MPCHMPPHVISSRVVPLRSASFRVVLCRSVSFCVIPCCGCSWPSRVSALCEAELYDALSWTRNGPFPSKTPSFHAPLMTFCCLTRNWLNNYYSIIQQVQMVALLDTCFPDILSGKGGTLAASPSSCILICAQYLHSICIVSCSELQAKLSYIHLHHSDPINSN